MEQFKIPESVYDCKPGDIIELLNGQKAEFINLKRKNFIAKIDGVPYSIRMDSFVKIVEKAKANEAYKNLKPGDLFYINHKGNAELYKFTHLENGKIVGTNPISNSRTTIPVSMYVGKISEIEGA